MMECQICGDTNGPFQFEQVDGPFKIPSKNNKESAILLICEDCWKKILKERKKRK